ncbi:hypothetical protein [Amycolatopsis sp. NPDC004079]|uniref:hypothetical protein n=1 Tax=Amycolatopsis sp. NPDC004079 TaxID=3154549 RepID=UPI0033B01B55
MGTATPRGQSRGDGPHRSQAGRAVPGMAPDVAMPFKHAHLPDGHPRQFPYWQRVLEQYLHGVQFLLTYLAFVDDGGVGVSAVHVEPQRECETGEQYRQRRDAVRMFNGARAEAGSWSELAAEEMRTIRPSDAGAVALWLIGQSHEWCQESGFYPRMNLHRAAASPLLHAMCPLEHLSRALEVLDMFWLEAVEERPPSVRETAARYPIATLHVTAAMTAGLFGEPDCVPDRVAALAQLLKFNQQLVDRLAR